MAFPALFRVGSLLLVPLVVFVSSGCSVFKTLEQSPSRVLILGDFESIRALADLGRNLPEDAAADIMWIGSWNMRYLGPSDQTPEETRSPGMFADYIRESGVDVLALLEVGTTSGRDGPVTSRFLDDVFNAIDDESDSNWRYLIWPCSEDTTALFGVAWNASRVTIDEPGWKLPIETGRMSTFALPICDRVPHAVRVSAGQDRTDIVLIIVHLQSDFGGVFAAAHREIEANEIVAQIGAVREQFDGEGDIVIIGDFNAASADESAMLVFRDAGFIDLNARDLGTFVSGMPFDRILAPAGESEFIPAFFTAVPGGFSSEQFQHFYSDHYLVLSPVRIVADDD